MRLGNDQDHFDLLELDKDTLEKLLQAVVGHNLERGDELIVSYMPFVEKAFGVQRFYLKNKEYIMKFFALLSKIKWVKLLKVTAVLVAVFPVPVYAAAVAFLFMVVGLFFD